MRSLHSKHAKVVSSAMVYLLLGTWAVGALIPFAWMVSSSFKDFGQIFRFPPTFIPNPVITDHYVRLFRDFPFFQWTRNSVFVAVPVVAGQVVCCSLAAYAFARIPFRGRDHLFLLYLGTMMIPSQVTIVPTYILMKYLHLVDKIYGLIIPSVLGGAYGTFLLRQFFMTIPQELEDAARIDGAGYFRIYGQIILPLSQPALATLAVFTLMGSWNSLLWPLIMINSERKRTLPLGLAGMVGQYATEWGLLMGGAILSLIPILVVFFAAQRYYVQGITLTGMKV